MVNKDTLVYSYHAIKRAIERFGIDQPSEATNDEFLMLVEELVHKNLEWNELGNQWEIPVFNARLVIAELHGINLVKTIIIKD